MDKETLKLSRNLNFLEVLDKEDKDTFIDELNDVDLDYINNNNSIAKMASNNGKYKVN